MGKTEASGKIQIDDKEWQRTKKIIDALKNCYTTVGVHKDAGNSPSGLPIAAIAHIQEYGLDSPGIKVTQKMRNYLRALGLYLKKTTEYIKIPERSFERAWVDEQKGAINTLVEKLIGEIIDGKITAMQGLGQLGEFAVTGMKNRILSGIPPANHPFTVMLKGSSGTLRDKGNLIGAITHNEVIGTPPAEG